MASDVAFEITGTDREELTSALSRPDASETLMIRTADGVLELPASAAAAARHLLVELASGASVHVLADEAELTTQEAADLLGISRTYIVRLIDQGKIRAHLVGTHRRLRAADVLAYREQREQRLADVAEITDSDIAAGVPYQ